MPARVVQLSEEVTCYWKLVDVIADALKDFDEAEHPRDEQGRWTDAGGGDAGGDAGGDSAGDAGNGARTIYGVTTVEALYTKVHRELRESKQEIPHVNVHLPTQGMLNFHYADVRPNSRGPRRGAYSRVEATHIKPGDKTGKIIPKAKLHELLVSEFEQIGDKKDFDEAEHPRDEQGRWTDAGGGGGGSSGESRTVTTPIGLGIPDGSAFARAGIRVVKYQDAEKIAGTLAKATGADLRETHQLTGGWTDPESNTYYPEPTLVAEFKGKPESIRLTAEAIAHVLGPQKEIWVVNDGEGLPSARDLRLDVMPTKPGITSQQLSDVARKVDPELFSGFTETVDDNGRSGISLLVKDGIAPWKSEPTSAIIKGYGQPFSVLINPSERDIRAMIKESNQPLLTAGILEEGVRVILDRDNNLYVWDSSNAIHASVEHVLSLDAQERDMWGLDKKGNIVGVAFSSPREVIADVAATPKGAAAIAAKADVGLLHLVEALDKAGIDAEVLPTAVSIDKRAADGEAGYSTSLEREAGVGAVAALDAYRARVVAALKDGKAPPDFDVDIVRLAAKHQRAQARLRDQSERLAASFSQALKDFDETEHPRDDHGRWTDAGAGGGGGAGGVEDNGQQQSDHFRLTSDAIIQEAPAYKPRSRSVPDVARDLNARAGRILKQQLGVNRIEGPDPKTDDYLARVISAELKSGLRNGHASATWYSDKMKEAMQIATDIHPEVKGDANKRWAFITSLAVTSQGEVVDSNARLTEQAYRQFEQTGKFPADLKVVKPAINQNFKKLNALVDKMGAEQTRQFMNREFVVRDLEKMGFRMHRMNKDDTVNGSAILGPKIGEGFYQNLNGNFKPLTMDIWFMRSWGRITNTGVREKGTVPPATAERLVKALRAENQPVPQSMERLADKARAIFREHEKNYIAHRADYKSGKREKSELVHAAERFHLHYDNGMIEAPRGGSDRNWMISVFNRAIAKLEADGIHLTPAAAQATWWTPEKALYDRLGARVREVETDYAKTLRKIAEARKSVNYEAWLCA